MLDRLAVPVTARLGEHFQEANEFLSWAAIALRAQELARGVPVTAGRRVAFGVQGPNGLATVLQIFAIFQAGGVPVPFALGTPHATVKECLERLGAAAIWDGGGWHLLAPGKSQPQGFDLIMHSSGSTGIPKPLAIRLEAMRVNALDVASALGLSTDDVHLGTMSQCYMSGFYNATMLPLFLGARTVSAPVATPGSMEALLAGLRRHRPTVLWLSPMIARMLISLRAVAQSDLSSVRLAISCTAPLPPRIKAEFEERFGVPLLQSYGLCETLITTVETPGQPRPGGVGKPVGKPGGVILDTDGQIVISNGAHFFGYLDAVADGAHLATVDPYATGDTGYFDPDGNLFVSGRLSETINVDGIKISPEIIEAALNAVPGVSDSAVLGIDDGRGITRLVALAVANESAMAALHQSLAERLPIVQRPKEIRQVGTIPRTANGKIDRMALRRIYASCAT